MSEKDHTSTPDDPQASKADDTDTPSSVTPESTREIGGYQGPEPTRYGDWEQRGRCTDF
ncbi:hypothetical protein CKO35_10890 [Ectothiorhodospira shaposhnikovii]|uniref:succinate dehydrogenase assembly factor 4 n=1 Tax=Ectothiorhodospira shaposhnikovii TaxID=1054 RepID=UPI001904B40A|nr:succinate dehydrogenase assembly factor 4 [Ectothiorhodospira shaposhnikovii]MBK1673801.1 hypothetical protein [Ectothiorhodospira shaposhnikovii]